MITPPSAPAGRSGRSALEVARAASEEAGGVALARFRGEHDVTIKGRGNLVTKTDLEIEAFLHQTFAREFPDHRVLSEETAAETGLDGWVWVIDPLDGTHNFVSGIPFFCVNVALCHDGAPVVGVTHDPNHSETLWAERGRGAWVNDAPARASQRATVGDAVLGVDLGYDNERGRETLRLIHALFPNAQALRVPGSAALGIAYAAAGRYDLFYHRFLFPWDLAAGILIVQEAGGIVTTEDGEPIHVTSSTVLAGGPKVHADFLGWRSAHTTR